MAASNNDAVVLWMGMEGCQMTKDFYFNTAKAMDKAKADRDKPVTPVEYIPVISDVGSDSNMLCPDTMYGLLPKGTGKITLHESKPAPMQEPHKDKIIKATLLAFGPDEGVTFTQDTWAKLHAAMSAVVAQQAPVQVSPLEFVTMVMEREHLVGKPLFWAEWPNKENT